MQTKVKSLMKEEPSIINAKATLKEAAQEMKSVDCGVLPVGSWDFLEGIITDRDIVVRAIAEGVDPEKAEVRDYMTTDICYCNEDDTLEEAANQMRRHNVSRLVVNNSSGRACGIITFGCMLRKSDDSQETNKVVALATGKKAA